MKDKDDDLEVEIFIHVAIGFSYSGRCYLSDFIVGKEASANKGKCAQLCRWNYNLYVENPKNKGELYPVIEDENGMTIFSSKDLCLIDELPEIVEMGVDSLKIEGRLKTENYLASIVNTYRCALDTILDGKEYDKDKFRVEIDKVKTRALTKFNFNIKSNDKIDEIKKISKDLNQEKDNFDNLKIEFSNFKKGAEAEFLRLNGEIKSRDVKINDLNFKINNLLREKANLEKKVDDLRREIFSKNQTITHLENQVSSLTKDVKNRDNKILGLEKDKYELENDKNNLISRLADFKDLEELEALYSEYLKIPENDREKYDAILKPYLGKDMFLYLVTTKFSNYKDFLKNDFIENADFYAVLVKIYDYVINVMNKEYDEEVYEFVNPEIGERYNPISQIPSSNSVSNGDVARVIVKGYQRKRDKKLLYQSIVLLK